MTLYHYCSTAAFHSIFHCKSIYLSSLSSSNDTLEGRWLSQALESLLEKRGIDPLVSETLLRWLREVEMLTLCYGFCLSSRRDMLSQWRGYADDAAGFAIGFSEERLKSLVGFDGGERRPIDRLIPVVYDQAEQEAMLEPELDRLLGLIGNRTLAPPTLLGKDPNLTIEEAMQAHKRFTTSVRNQMMRWNTLIFTSKNPAFAEEGEQRLIKDEFLSHIGAKFRVRGSDLVPYAEVKFPKDVWPSLVEEVIIGPKNKTPLPVVLDFVMSCDSRANVAQSSASYR